jgi:Phage tail tube protein, GTA-gp10
MANPHKGEVEFSVEGKTYKLCFSVNALCELEAVAGEPAGAVFGQLSDLSKARYSTWRALFWAALRDHHADVTLTDAGRLMTALGMTQVVPLVHGAVTLAFPQTEAPSPLADQVASQPAGTG